MDLRTHKRTSRNLGLIAIAAGLVTVSACAPAPVEVAAPPPVQLVPPRPTPPAGAAAALATPKVASNGVRQTVNTGLSNVQTIWNLRAGLNVAALSCRDARHSSILGAYETYLSKHERELSRTNSAVSAEFRADHGSSYRSARDTFMTQVYNYFALPPALDAFCDEAVRVVSNMAAVPAGGLSTNSATSLAQLDGVFARFFNAYDQYQRDLANWNATYGPNAQPGTPVTVAPTGALPPSG